MKSLHKVLHIIDTVADAGKAGIRNISALTGYSPATIHRIVSTLVEKKYFVQDPATKKYALSLKFLELGTRVQHQIDLTGIARPHLHRLMGETREGVNLAVPVGDEMVYLDHVRSDHSLLQLFTKPGARVPLYATGVGKLFLSRMNEADFEAYLDRTNLHPRTPSTIVEREALRKELDHILAVGFSVDNEEFEAGVRCVAALIFDHSSLPAAAVSISGAVVRITPDRIDHFGKMVRRCAHDISLEFGFNPMNGKS
ncbi:MAG: IclR family transcriptional regulator [Pseudomonadota bacterium]